MKQNDTFDIVKYVLALMVVAIHCGYLSIALYPWLRAAVPLFYMISSYLFYSRTKDIDTVEQYKATKKYITRNFKYYCFWFVVLIPITIYVRRGWYDGNTFKLVLKIISQTLFSSTFVASWYIIGGIWGVFLISKLKNISEKLIIVLVAVIYCILCIRSSYYDFFSENAVISNVVNTYEVIFCIPYNSFPIAFCWMFVGKMFAEYNPSKRMLKYGIIGVAFSLIALFIEWKMVYSRTGDYRKDCYFMLAPLCIFIFYLILNINLKCKYAKTLRTISTIMYPLHASLFYIIWFVFSKININNKWIEYFTAIVLCHLASYLITKLENTKYGGILKYSH